jgi:hypothetical protein
VLRDLHALVKGECPSLLNEDSGGDADLDLRIKAALSAPASEGWQGMETAPKDGDEAWVYGIGHNEEHADKEPRVYAAVFKAKYWRTSTMSHSLTISEPLCMVPRPGNPAPPATRAGREGEKP